MAWALLALLQVCAALGLNFTSPSAETHFQFLLSRTSPLQNGYFAYSRKTGATIVLREMVKRTDCVVKVPIRFVITSADDYALSEWLDGFSQLERMTIRLMYERFSSLRWGDYTQAYVQALPSDFLHPLTWSDSDFLLLETHTMEPHSRDELRKFDLNGLLHHINFALKTAKDVPKAMLTREAVLWGVLTAASRAIRVTAELAAALGNSRLNEDSCVFIPGMDVINHFPFKPSKKKQNLSFFASNLQETDPWVCYRALRLQQANSQFAGNYGDKTNFDLMTSYGFALEYNPEDEVDMKFPMDDYCLGTKEGDYCTYKTKLGSFDLRILKSMLGSMTGIVFKDTYGVAEIERYLLSLKNGFQKKREALGVFLNYRNNFVYRISGTPLRTLRRESGKCEEDKCALILTYCIAQRTGRYTHAQKMERELLKLFSADIIS